MIHFRGGYPGSTGVTGFAHAGAGNMCRAFSDGRHAVMTRDAGTSGFGVIHADHRRPHT